MSANKVHFGVKNAVVWPITETDDGLGNITTTYGAAVKWPGAVGIDLQAQGSQENFYADDGVYYIVSNTNFYEGDFESASVPDAVKTAIYGDVTDTNGAIVEVNCETSFVAKTDEFKTLAHQIAMQIASMNPLYVSEEDIPEDVKAAKMKELEENFKGPENMKEQILAGQAKKAFADKVLMNQPFILDDTKTVEQFIKEAIAKTGENITIRQFKRIELGVTE